VSIRVLVGDCRDTLSRLSPGSIQAAITSPPYYGLRDYGTEPLVWGGDPEHAHEWRPAHTAGWYGSGSGVGSTLDLTSQAAQAAGRNRGSMGECCACGAWCGSHGLEPTPELYVQHEVQVFREVRRVLRDDGVLWLNLGDSYAGSGKGPSKSLNNGNSHAHQAALAMGHRAAPEHAGDLAGRDINGHQRRVDSAPGLKAKDLLMMPFRVAMALQADGWFLRSVIPWLKRNPMPESVTDRPSSAIEYVFLLAKSQRYYWDADAIRVAVTGNAHTRGDGVNPKSVRIPSGWDTSNGAHTELTGRYRPRQNASFSAATAGVRSTPRNRRNSDWFFEAWQGLLLDEQDDPLALLVNPARFSGAHYATFPPKLLEPMVKASTREGDAVLDPFGGAGTVGLVADRLGRDAVLCELKDDYVAMGQARIRDDAPLFVQIDGDGTAYIQPELISDKQAASGLSRYVGFNARWDARKATNGSIPA